MGDEGILSRISAEVTRSDTPALLAYLHGAARDGTFNRHHGTWRISQSSEGWLRLLQGQIARLGRRAWIYREARRSVWALETKLDLAEPPAYDSRAERMAFARGYFDAEGGVPRSACARFYVQFVQNDLADLGRVRTILVEEGIACGALHNPSRRVDPDFWRFYVRAASLRSFCLLISSWHPRKRAILDDRLGATACYGSPLGSFFP